MKVGDTLTTGTDRYTKEYQLAIKGKDRRNYVGKVTCMDEGR